VIPFLLGNPGESAPYKAGIEITDSIYVVLNMVVLAKCGKVAADVLDSIISSREAEVDTESDTDTGTDTDWYLGVHSTGSDIPQSEDNRYICHFPNENEVWAVNTGFGVNAFLTKESIALRLASCTARKEGWLAEHMAILEIQTPTEGDPKNPKTTYIAAAFPSGCGKTSLAMLDVPKSYADRGYKVRCISEDIAWLKKGKDGRLWAANPEAGIFGLAFGLNGESNPNVLTAANKDSIFTNTAFNSDDDTVWWENLNNLKDSEESANLLDWKGNEFKFEEILSQVEDDIEDDIIDDFAVVDEVDDYVEVDDFEQQFEQDDGFGEAHETAAVDGAAEPVKPKATPKPAPARRAAHSNSRFTVPITNCPNLSEKYGDADGVPISAIVFGGKRSKTVPLVYQAFDWEHGVFVGSVLGSEPTTGSSNTVRRDPMAMLPYCGYNMADYWRHWLKMGKKLGRNAPKVFNVNWFKIGENGTPVWPGYGENIRVLDWIVERVSSKKFSIIETPVGYTPKAVDIDIDGLEGMNDELLIKLLSVEKAPWKEDVNSVKQFYAKFGDKLPEELKKQLIDLEKRLMNY